MNKGEIIASAIFILVLGLGPALFVYFKEMQWTSGRSSSSSEPSQPDTSSTGTPEEE